MAPRRAGSAPVRDPWEAAPRCPCSSARNTSNRPTSSHAFRERLLDGLHVAGHPARIGEELLSTTRLPLAVSFLCTDVKGPGPDGARPWRGSAITSPPFQTHVVDQAEQDTSRFAMEQALLVLEREAKFKAENPSLPAPVRLPVRGTFAQPPGLHQGPGRHGRRSVLHRGLAGLHPDPAAAGWATLTSPT